MPKVSRPKTIAARLQARSQLVRFEEDEHRYFVGSDEVPSVTRILDRVAPYVWEPPEYYLELGAAIHYALQLADEDDLPRQLHPKVKPYVESYQEFVGSSGWEVLGVEVRLAGARYAGTLDRLFYDRKRGRLILLDFKRTQPPLLRLRLQLTAYKQLVRLACDHPTLSIECWALYWEDGKIKTEVVPESAHDERAWSAAVILYNYLDWSVASRSATGTK